jgi:hypothetical protein
MNLPSNSPINGCGQHQQSHEPAVGFPIEQKADEKEEGIPNPELVFTGPNSNQYKSHKPPKFGGQKGKRLAWTEVKGTHGSFELRE